MENHLVPEDNFGFFVASSDRDVLSQVSDLLRRKGCLGFADTAGRMHYLVDGRKGTAFAARNILDTAGYAIRLDGERRRLINPVLEQAVSRALAEAGLSTHLKGYRYLHMMIVLSIREGIDPWPVSKTLYPAAATYFRTTPKRIERDLRYSIRLSGGGLRPMTNSLAIHTLRETAMRLAEEMAGTEYDARGDGPPLALVGETSAAGPGFGGSDRVGG